MSDKPRRAKGPDEEPTESQSAKAQHTGGTAAPASSAPAAATPADGPVEAVPAETPEQPVDQEAGTRAEVIGVRRGMFGAKGSPDTSGYGGLIKTVEFPAGSLPPYGGWFDEVYDRICELLPNHAEAITRVVVHRGEITFYVEREHLAELIPQLRDDAVLRFEFCSSISGVHYPADLGRELHAVYHLQSMTHNRRIRLEVTAPDADPHIPSVVATYPTADWHERETYDMFGIIFDGHPALTRILMPDDWPGHPQRKDYPLGGIEVEYKGASIPPPDQRRSYN
jgi:NADH-quinone oxidoreductase subunit C